MTLLDTVLGRPLATSEEEEHKIGVFAGVPSLGLDALSSASYGPEAALAILIPAGAAGLAYLGPISAVILVLLGILYFSYRQTISAYPNGGGSYTVARENLGNRVGLLAAASLMLDYILNVAVGISAGVGALVSAAPKLHPYILVLCLGILALVTLINLRGVREPGLLFSVPTYLFVASLLGVIAVGIWKTWAQGGHPAPIEVPPALSKSLEGVSLWLILRAFASGCTAMTGVEAVSNGTPNFAEPRVKRAEYTLTFIVGVLGLLLAGIAYLARVYHIGAMDQEKPDYQSVVSQLVGAVAGRGFIYYVTIASVLAVLALSANTSFADFPRLCRLVALDGYLPRVLSQLGRRLVYSAGILALAGLSGAILVGFGGITDRLIPLFAVGAFGAFTCSQAGMVAHWRRQGGHGARSSLVINAVGAVSTGAALLVILVAKFTEGAWITLLAVPVVLFIFYRVKWHYVRVSRQIHYACPFTPEKDHTPLVVVPIEGWNRVTAEALRFATQISTEVIAVHVITNDGVTKPEASDPCPIWEEEVAEPARRAGVSPPRLEAIDSPYRLLFNPLLDFIKRLRDEQPAGRLVAVIVPQLSEVQWYQSFLHNYRARGLCHALRALKDPRIIVISMPWYLAPEDGRPVSLLGAKPVAAVQPCAAAQRELQG